MLQNEIKSLPKIVTRFYTLNMDLENFLNEVVKNDISDIHFKVGTPPIVRQYTTLKVLPQYKQPLNSEDMEVLFKMLTNKRSQKKFEEKLHLDTIYSLPGVGRFRSHISQQRGSLRIVMRRVPHSPLVLEQLNLPSILTQFCAASRGLILVTGATGCGKSSTLAAMVEYINNHQSRHILTIEDPIEFLIKDKKSLITQQEIGIDTHSYTESLTSALRQDPDVIFIGELRDKDSIDMALTSASTGHLVMASIHSTNCQETINRILVEFSGQKQEQIRSLLLENLIALINLRLCKRKQSSKLIPAAEIMVNNERIKELIMNNRLTEIASAIEQHGKYGSQSFNQSLTALVKAEKIDFEEALKHSSNPQQLRTRFGRDKDFKLA